MEINKLQKSGVAIASLILGIISFVPLIGVLLGIIAIILGAIALVQVKKQNLGGKGLAKGGIVLGILGIVFTVLIYSALFFFAFKSNKGPWVEQRVKAIQQMLIGNAGSLELYKKKHGKYPKILEQARKEGFQIYPFDFSNKPFHYKVSEDGQAYELRSLGADGIYGTKDDIFLPQQLLNSSN